MAFRHLHSSKFSHVCGQPLKREKCYDNIRVSKNTWDSTFCAVNPKFLAVIVESAGGGAFIVLPQNKPSRIAVDHPLVAGHTGPVLDIAWCPHNDNIIASASEDCVVKLWHIPDEGLSETLTEPVVDLRFHQRRVGLLLWHPSALNVLLTAGADKQIVIWNVGTGEILVHIESPDDLYSASFNWNGSKLVTTCRDKKIRIYDSRSGEIQSEALSHEAKKATRAIFLRNGLIFTTGFKRSGERQYSLRAPDALDDPIVMQEVDQSNGVMFPLYDADTNLIFLCGKGDSAIRYYEITPEPPFVHYIDRYQIPHPQRGIGMMPKRGCEFKKCEIARLYRLNHNGLCQVISMIIPRKTEFFQEDLYPDTLAEDAAQTAEEWIAGNDADPLMFSLKDGFASQPGNRTVSLIKKANLLCKTKSTSSAVLNGDQVDDMSKMKAIIVKQEMRLRTLESRMFYSDDEKDECQKATHPVEGCITYANKTDEDSNAEDNGQVPNEIQDCAYDESAYVETAYDESAYDETVYEENAYDGTVYDENAYEESAYDENAYDESAYDENAYDENAYDENAYDESVPESAANDA